MRIISMPTKTGRMPGNLAVVPMLGNACISSKASLGMRVAGASIAGT